MHRQDQDSTPVDHETDAVETHFPRWKRWHLGFVLITAVLLVVAIIVIAVRLIPQEEQGPSYGSYLSYRYCYNATGEDAPYNSLGILVPAISNT